MAFIEELQRRLTPKEGSGGLAPGVSQSVPDLAAAVEAAEQREAAQHQQSPFELRALEVVLDVVRAREGPLMWGLHSARYGTVNRFAMLW